MIAPRAERVDPAVASLLLMGDTAHRDGDFELAERCYVRALKRSRHPGGRFNLAIARLYLGRFDLALDGLMDLDEELAGAESPTARELRLSVRYDAVLARWYLAEETDDGSGLIREAALEARAVALDLADLLRDPDTRGDHQRFVHTLSGGAVALLAALDIEAFCRGIRFDGEDSEDQAGGSDAGFVRRRLLPATGGGVEEPDWAALVEDGAWFTPRTAIELARIVRGTHAKDARTRYDLALLTARRLRGGAVSAEDRRLLSIAFDDLAYAIKREPHRRRWARRDVLIDPLRRLDERRFLRALGLRRLAV